MSRTTMFNFTPKAGKYNGDTFDFLTNAAIANKLPTNFLAIGGPFVFPPESSLSLIVDADGKWSKNAFDYCNDLVQVAGGAALTPATDGQENTWVSGNVQVQIYGDSTTSTGQTLSIDNGSNFSYETNVSPSGWTSSPAGFFQTLVEAIIAQS
ncbi:MAG: hypothetical protein MI974_09775 [Chitinophagales bacterium]|nr:hypothetical protein [Chitinophagales bacterium]